MTNQPNFSPTTAPDLDWDSLQVLGRSSTVTISLGYDPKGSKRYFVKTPIKRGSASSDIEAKLRFKRELDNAAALDHPGIASPFPLFDNELKGIIYGADDAGLLSKAASEKMLAAEVVIDAGVQILDALEYLHRRGIVHGNISPQTISIDTAQQVRFLDLGYVITDSGKSPSDGEVIGTFPYLSPEQMGITEFGIDSRSDLFCVAAMLYRLISGVYPFPGGEIGIRKLMEEIVRTEPRPLSAGSPFLNGVFFKALHASPTERYQTAEGFRHDLVLALSELRDSILVTAKPGSRDRIASVNSADVFVGREGEIGLLRRMLENLISYRKPSSLLVYGISGVGKTGLVREFERQLNPEECLFLSSKCNRHTTTQPYALINGLILDLLIKVSRMEPQERDRTLAHLDGKLAHHSGVLCRSIPELSGIFRKVRNIDQIEPEKESARVHFTMTAFLEEISRFIPLVIFADDFQWVDRGSFEVFRRFAGCESPFLLVCSYRTPAPEALPRIEDLDLTTLFGSSIQVKAFLKGEIRELLASCFGTLDGIESLSESLYDRTDRLPLTLRESMRFVVNSGMLVPSGIGWRLRQDALVPFPQRFDFPSLILDKLKNLDEQDHAYLEWASLIEGKFDPKIIIEAAGLESSAAGEIRNRLVQQGFLVRRYGGLLAFSHDKIQESIAGGVGEERQRGMHFVLGGIFEKISESDPSFLGECAEHYMKSGHIQKTCHLCEAAANHASKRIAYESAQRYYELILEIIDKADYNTVEMKARIELSLANTLQMIGKNIEAANHFSRVLRSNMHDQDTRLRIKYKIGFIYHSMGSFDESIQCFSELLRDLDIVLSKKAWKCILIIIYQCLKLSSFRFLFPKECTYLSRNARQLAVSTLSRIAYSLFFTDILQGLVAHLKGLNIAHSLDLNPEKAEIFAFHTVPAFQFRFRKRAFQYGEQGLSIAKATHQPDVIAITQCLSGVLYYYAGRWNESHDYSEQSLNTYSSIGDKWGQLTSIEHLAYAFEKKGELPKSADLYLQMYSLGRECDDMRGTMLGLKGYCQMLQYLGKNYYVQASEILEKLPQAGESLIGCMVRMSLISIELHKDNLALAHKYSIEALSLVKKYKLYTHEYTAGLYSCICEIMQRVYLGRLLDRDEVPSIKKPLRNLRRYALFTLAVGMIFPAYAGAGHRSLGWYFAFKNLSKIGAWFFRKAIKSHKKFEMKYELAKSHRDYALFLEQRKRLKEAQKNFDTAYQLFESCGAKPDCERLREKVSANIFDTAATAAATANVSTTDPDHGAIRFETLFEVSSSVAGVENYDELLRRILSGMIRASGAQYGTLFLDAQESHGEKMLSLDHESLAIESNTPEFAQSIVTRARESGEPVLVRDARIECPGFGDIEKCPRSVLCIPLMRAGTFLGAVYLANDLVSGLFSEGSRKTAQIFSAQACVLIENARLVEQYRNLNRNLEDKVRGQTRDLLGKKEQLQETNIKLIDSERMRTMLTGTIIHDIKNRIYAIAGDLRYVDRKATLDPETRKRVSKAARSCSGVFNLATDVLDIGKMEEGKIAISRQKLYVEWFVSQVELICPDIAGLEKNIDVRFERLPEEDYPVIDADPKLMERVLQNLFNNAGKYTPENGVVRLAVRKENGQATVSVYNSGPPIPENDRESIFNKYYRIGETYSRQSKGLGLYFCKLVMAAHGGRIWVDADEQGNTFKLSFPEKTADWRLSTDTWKAVTGE